MKKIAILFCISLFISNYSDGQQSLTNGSAFDLQVGDSVLYRPVYWYDCYANPFTVLTYYDYGGIIGYVVDSRQDLIDSIIYSVHFNQDSGSLVINDLDSSVDKFTGLTGTFVNTDAGKFLSEAGFSIGLGSGGGLYYTCDSTAVDCYTDTIISIVNGGVLIHFTYGFFEWGGTKSLLEKCGLYEHSGNSNQGSICWGGAAGMLPGGYNINLTYYRSDSTIWIDSVLFYYNNIEEIQSSLNTLSLYPNPAQSFITIVSADGKIINQVTVTDLLGRIIYSAQTNSQSSIINCQLFPSAVYFIKAQLQDGTSLVKKFVKE